MDKKLGFVAWMFDDGNHDIQLVAAASRATVFECKIL